MDFIVKDLYSTYKLDTFRNKTDKIIFEISSANCPYCGKASNRIHSRYKREVQNLPIQGKKAVLLKKMPTIVDNLSVRKVCVDDFAIRV